MSIEDINRGLAELAELVPDRTELHTVGKRWSERELAEFEREHGVALPDDYRTYLREVGDGGAGFAFHGSCCGGIASLRDAAEGADLSGPFPLSESFNEGEGSSDGLDRGWLRLGQTPSHYGLLLVVAGPGSGQLWKDSRGYEFGGLDPTGETFTEAQSSWLQQQLSWARRQAAASAALEGSVKDIRRELNAKSRYEQLKTLVFEHRKKQPTSEQARVLRNLALASHRDKGSEFKSAMALVQAHAWSELATVAAWGVTREEVDPDDMVTVQARTTWLTYQALAREGCALAGAELGGHPPREYPPQAAFKATELDAMQLAVPHFPVALLRAFLGSGHPTVVLRLLKKIPASTAAALDASLAQATRRGAASVEAGEGEAGRFKDGVTQLVKTLVNSEERAPTFAAAVLRLGDLVHPAVMDWAEQLGGR